MTRVQPDPSARSFSPTHAEHKPSTYPPHVLPHALPISGALCVSHALLLCGDTRAVRVAVLLPTRKYPKTSPIRPLQWALLCISVTRKQAGGENRREKRRQHHPGGGEADEERMEPSGN